MTWSGLVAGVPLLAMVGAVCGFFSGLVIATAENRRSFKRLTFRRMAVWGALGGMVIPAGYIVFNFPGLGLLEAIKPLAVFGVLGAVTSSGTLAIARRAPELAPAHHPKELSGDPV